VLRGGSSVVGELKWPRWRGWLDRLYLSLYGGHDAGERRERGGGGVEIGDGDCGVLEMSTLEGETKTRQGCAMVKISAVMFLGR
jgi:hypothetical protein